MTVPPPFVLDLRSINGGAVGIVDDGEGGELGLHEWTSWLRIRSDVTGFVAPVISPEDDEITGFVPPVFEDDGLAVLVHLRDHQDLGGRAIGLFHARLELAELDAVRTAIAGVPWPTLPQPVGGHFDAPHLTLRYASGKLVINRRFNARSDNFIAAIAPLWHLLHKLMARTKRGPSGTLEPILDVKLDQADPLHCNFRFGVRNRSIGPIAVTEPRILDRSGRPRIELLVGECVVDRDDVPPFDWTTIDLPPAEPGVRSLMLPSRKRWELELPWRAPKPGRYEVRMRWRDYDGPLEPLPGQTPFMPVPSTGPSFVGSGPYPVRGCCEHALRFEIPDELQSPTRPGP